VDEDKRDLVETLSSRLDSTNQGFSVVGEVPEDCCGRPYHCLVSAHGSTKIYVFLESGVLRANEFATSW